jgi:hypothetical protein
VRAVLSGFFFLPIVWYSREKKVAQKDAQSARELFMKYIIPILISAVMLFGCATTPREVNVASQPPQPQQSSSNIGWEDPYTQGMRAVIQHEDGSQEEILVRIVPLSGDGLNILTVYGDTLVLQFYLSGYSIQIFKRPLPKE